MERHSLFTQLTSVNFKLYNTVQLFIYLGLWIMAAKFEFEERQDANAARTLFLQGLRVNSSCKKLWLEVNHTATVYYNRVYVFLSIIGWS